MTLFAFLRRMAEYCTNVTVPNSKIRPSRRGFFDIQDARRGWVLGQRDIGERRLNVVTSRFTSLTPHSPIMRTVPTNCELPVDQRTARRSDPAQRQQQVPRRGIWSQLPLRACDWALPPLLLVHLVDPRCRKTLTYPIIEGRLRDHRVYDGRLRGRHGRR